MKTIIYNRQLAKAILRRLCQENEVDPDNVRISKFGYVETIDHSKKDVTFCSTIFTGQTYMVDFIDGCFAPFIVRIDKP